MPASFLIYMESPSRVYSLTAKLVSRTVQEAQDNLRDLNILRAWRMPMSTYDEPETLRLYAYGNNIKGIPVVMTSISTDFPSDVDYVNISGNTYVPIIQTVTMSFKEIRSFDDVQLFSYTSYKAGTLDGW